FLIFSSFAQLGIGEWRDHLSYSQAISVAETKSSIFCSTRSGLFDYDKATKSIRRLSKVSGLSETDISAIKYNEDKDILFIAYSNANIDLIEGTSIINLSDIYRKQIVGKKTINNIMMHGNCAYLSCGFGIVVVDLDKKEIEGTYYIGDEGSQVEVFETCTDDSDIIYAATETGIYMADINNNNLENYNYWVRDTRIANADKKFNSICYFNGRVFVNSHNEIDNTDQVYYKENSNWNSFYTYSAFNRALSCSYEKLIVNGYYRVNVFDKNLNLIKTIDNYEFDTPSPYYAIFDDSDILWIADNVNGLVRSEDLINFESIYPEGPYDSNIWDIEVSGENLWVAGGGMIGSWNNSWSQSGLSAIIDNKWEVFNYTTIDEMEDVKDIIKVIIDPQNPNKVYAGSWGYGLLEFENGELQSIYNEDNTNGALQNIIPGSPYVRIAGLAFDSNNNLWITNTGVDNPISVKKADGSWKNFHYDVGESFMGDIVITPYNHKWVILPRGHGLLAFDNKNTIDDESDDEDERVPVRVLQPNGTIIQLNDVYSIALDLESRLWVGTNNGVVVFYVPERVFTNTNFYGSQPSVDLGDSLYHALLGTETVTAIAVDGANRKWLGTESSGVYLVSESGDKELLNFNIDNSPLPSNKIISIAINDDSGEVYFGTAKGIVSYRSDAVKQDFGNQQVYVFPNPVRENYDGPITVRGLPYNSEVKITDIAGNLVFETESLGGQAIWYGKDIDGREVQTGVYFIFASNFDASQKVTTKLLYIRSN
ncbi:hypothetical protein ACFLSY_09030, partial [Bacteroidota bacterium]